MSKRPFWPTSKPGKTALAVFVVGGLLFSGLGINFLTRTNEFGRWVPLLLRFGLPLASLGFAYVAVFKKADKAWVNIFVIALVGLNTLFWILFLLGEVLFPHP